jgi:CheY-like chemotaxis protein/HPt (histidine-containing phosphotransfer) domain-containing protein
VRALGVDGYLLKPVLPGELLETIRRLVGAAPAPTAGEAPAPREPGARRLDVLLAEDNKVNQMLAVRLLEKQGHRVTVAGDGAEALDLSARRDFDLVLMDVQMPEVDGLEATRRIRERESGAGKHVPIVAMTAHAMKGDRERCLAAGMDDYVSKPIEPAELGAVIDRVARRRALGPAGRARVDALPDFDLTMAMRMVADDRELLRTIAGMFLEQGPMRVQAVRVAHGNDDPATIERSAHSLKGAAAALALPRLHAVAGEVELAGATEDLAAVDTLLPELDRVLGDASRALRRELEVD